MFQPARRSFTAASWQRWSFRDSALDGFAANAGPVLAHINLVHPLREGSGHTQLKYLNQCAGRAID